MATNYILRDTFYIYGLGSWNTSGSTSYKVNFSETVRLSDSSVLEQVVVADITTTDTIQLREDLDVSITQGALCFPYGNPEYYTYISLEENVLENENEGIGGVPNWQWQGWTIIHGYQFGYLDRPYTNWGFSELKRKAPVTTEDGIDKIFGGKVYLTFNITSLMIKCTTDFITFLVGPQGFPKEGGASWLENCNPDGKHKRRIRLYPTGLLGADRTGVVIDPVEVRWSKFPLSSIKRVNNRYGVYEIGVNLKSITNMSHDTYQQFITWGTAI